MFYIVRNILKKLLGFKSTTPVTAPTTTEPAPPAPRLVTSVSPVGLRLIKQFEGCKLDAYKCPAGIWTIGYGHTGPDVTPDLQISQTEADRLLTVDVRKFEAGVTGLGVKLTQGQFDALVSFAYNVGLKALQTSTLLKKLKLGDVQGAADELLRWNKAGGQILTGLALRRQAERAVFLG